MPVSLLFAAAATNGIAFAQDPEFAVAAAKAGLRIAYLQFDGVSEEANAHPNLQRAALASDGRELAKTSVITTLNTMVAKHYLSRKKQEPLMIESASFERDGETPATYTAEQLAATQAEKVNG